MRDAPEHGFNIDVMVERDGTLRIIHTGKRMWPSFLRAAWMSFRGRQRIDVNVPGPLMVHVELQHGINVARVYTDDQGLFHEVPLPDRSGSIRPSPAVDPRTWNGRGDC